MKGGRPDACVACAGLVTLLAAKAFGADVVAIADIKRDNLDLAMKLGADVALNPDRDAPPQARAVGCFPWGALNALVAGCSYSQGDVADTCACMSPAPQEVATWMRAALPPNGPDVVIDCAGFEPTLQVRATRTSDASHHLTMVTFVYFLAPYTDHCQARMIIASQAEVKQGA